MPAERLAPGRLGACRRDRHAGASWATAMLSGLGSKARGIVAVRALLVQVLLTAQASVVINPPGLRLQSKERSANCLWRLRIIPDGAPFSPHRRLSAIIGTLSGLRRNPVRIGFRSERPPALSSPSRAPHGRRNNAWASRAESLSAVRRRVVGHRLRRATISGGWISQCRIHIPLGHLRSRISVYTGPSVLSTEPVLRPAPAPLGIPPR
jgi:hypothetical protein